MQQQHEKRRLKRDVFSAGYPAGFADEFSSLFSGATRSGHPYPDPLYKEEWYLVSVLFIFFLRLVYYLCVKGKW